jgi:hypothetical protein
MIALSPRMRGSTSRTGALALALCVGTATTMTSGCSLLFVDGPPANAQKLRSFNCTTSNSLPVTDAVIGGLFALSAVGAATGSSGTSGSTTTSDVSAAIGTGVVAAAFAVSAGVGYSRTSACKDATAELMTRIYPGPGAPGFAPTPYAPSPYMPAPQPYDPWTAPAPGAAPPPPAPGAAPGAGPWGAPPASAPAPPAAPPPSAPPPAPPPGGARP